jgi:hypothetical protein
MRGIPIDMLRHGTTHLVSASGRYLGFITTKPEHVFTIWEIQVYEPVSTADVQHALDGEDEYVKFNVITLTRRKEAFNAGQRGRFRILTYEVAPGEEKLLWNLDPGFFISAGELFGEKIDEDPLAGIPRIGRRG